MRISDIEKDKKKIQRTKSKSMALEKELDRVDNVLKNIDCIADDLDEQFKKKTDIFNKTDMTFMFTAVLLQSLRWVLLSELKIPQMEQLDPEVSHEERLKANEKNHKGGRYDGRSSGSMYESDKLKEYRNKYEFKTKASTNEFYDGKNQYRSWIEILTQPVPYDAMNELDYGSTPNVAGLNNMRKDGTFSNLSATNHHVASLGHDPALGWIFGTMNIMSSTISLVTMQNFGVVRGHSYRSRPFEQTNLLNFSDQKVDYATPWLLTEIISYCIKSIKEDSKRLPAAVVRQGIHLASDQYCKEGLPIRFLSVIDPQKAQHLIEQDWNDEELKILLKKDFGNIALNATISILINLIIEAIYIFLVDAGTDDVNIKRIRIKKILMVSNVISSSSNIIYVAITKNIKKLDIGGIGVTLCELFKDINFIKSIKQEFITKGFEHAILADDDWLNYILEEEL